MLRILVIDAQGGGIGKQIISGLRARKLPVSITAVGTNTLATTAMLRAGADAAATGENAVTVCARRADIITGPIGIIIADAMLGEITPAMATALSSSDAVRVLIPMNRTQCENYIVGVRDNSLTALLDEAADTVVRLAEDGTP